VNAPTIDGSLREQVLLDLSLWLSRVQQYSPDHPACAQLREKTHQTVLRALGAHSPLAYGVLKDEIMIDGAPARHPVLRTRVAPFLHARGVLLLRFVQGVTAEELAHLVDLLILPEQTIFDRGGLLRLAIDRQIGRIQIEEIAHDISVEERDAQARRTRLRMFFKDMLRTTLSRRKPDAAHAEQIVELLDHPELIVTLLEEDAVGIAEAAAGLALILQQQEQRTGEPVTAKLVPALLGLAPASRVRLLLGFPSLAGEFRRALGRVLHAMNEQDLTKLVFPSVRAHASDLEAVFYALSAAVPHDGTRYSALRRIGLALFDLGSEDVIANDVLSALTQPIPEHDSFLRERECLREPAARALSRRGGAAARARSVPPEAPAPFDGSRSVADVIDIAMRTRTFDRFCQRLVRVAPTLGGDGALGALRGLSVASAAHPVRESRHSAREAQREVALVAAPEVLADLERATPDTLQTGASHIAATVALLCDHAPSAVLDRLDVTESRAFRRIMLDALAGSSADLLPLIRPRLHSSKWYVVRNAVLLVPRARGTGAELLPIAQHPREQVRREIIQVLRNLRDEAAMEIVAMYLSDSNAEIAAYAPSLLRGELLGFGAIARLEAIAADDHRAEDLRRRVIFALGRCPRDEAAAALFRILQPKSLVDLGSGVVRDLAASALRHSPAATARNFFEDGLKSSAWRVRKACERALEQK